MHQVSFAIAHDETILLEIIDLTKESDRYFSNILLGIHRTVRLLFDFVEEFVPFVLTSLIHMASLLVHSNIRLHHR